MARKYSDREVKRLIAEAIAPLLARIRELETENARLKKNSTNSSKPPSSDIVKPAKPAARDGGQRKIGGQPGHARHQREPFAAEQIDRVERQDLKVCPDCGGRVRRCLIPPRVIQQAELVAQPVEIVEYQVGACLCLQCGTIHYAALPAEAEQGGLRGRS